MNDGVPAVHDQANSTLRCITDVIRRVILIRAICLYIARTCASKASHWSGPTPFLDAARYSGGTPSTISMAAVPRTSKTCGGKAFVSTVNATFGFVFSADTLGACGSVQSTN